MDGILNINKPAGRSSFNIVAQVRRLSDEKRVGHTGTLDPSATGVLPVCLGKGTRVVEFMVNDTKTYLAEIELGTTTDTYDSSGNVVNQEDISTIDRDKLDIALEAFRGKIHQIPPMYSSIKSRGQPLYKLARKGIEVERKSRPVTIHRLEVRSWQTPVLTLEIECSKGTYVRSLAHDLGQSLGCGGHLKSLVRTRCGVFDIEDAVSMPELESAFRRGYWQQYVHPMDTALKRYRAVIVDYDTEEIISRGGRISLEEKDNMNGNVNSGDKLCRAYSLDGRFLGILRSLPEKGAWQPRKVFI
jgi:tRNA pseudouridine55 synthase